MPPSFQVDRNQSTLPQVTGGCRNRGNAPRDAWPPVAQKEFDSLNVQPKWWWWWQGAGSADTWDDLQFSTSAYFRIVMWHPGRRRPDVMLQRDNKNNNNTEEWRNVDARSSVNPIGQGGQKSCPRAGSDFIRPATSFICVISGAPDLSE